MLLLEVQMLGQSRAFWGYGYEVGCQLSAPGDRDASPTWDHKNVGAQWEQALIQRHRAGMRVLHSGEGLWQTVRDSLFPSLSPEEHKVHIQIRAILLRIYSLLTQGKFQWELWKYVQKAFSKHIWPLQLASVFRYWDPIWAEDFIMAKICHWHYKAVVFTLSHSVTKQHVCCYKA